MLVSGVSSGAGERWFDSHFQPDSAGFTEDTRCGLKVWLPGLQSGKLAHALIQVGME